MLLYLAQKLLQGFLLTTVFARCCWGRNPGFSNWTTIVYGYLYRIPISLQETLVHSCNCLAIKAMKGAKKHMSFIKSCIAFSEVTISSIPGCHEQFNLYLETVEVNFLILLLLWYKLMQLYTSCLFLLQCIRLLWHVV